MRQLHLDTNILSNPLQRRTPAAAWQLSRDPFRFLPRSPAAYRNVLAHLADRAEPVEAASRKRR
jgi:hypothetical protein